MKKGWGAPARQVAGEGAETAWENQKRKTLFRVRFFFVFFLYQSTNLVRKEKTHTLMYDYFLCNYLSVSFSLLYQFVRYAFSQRGGFIFAITGVGFPAFGGRFSGFWGVGFPPMEGRFSVRRGAVFRPWKVCFPPVVMPPGAACFYGRAIKNCRLVMGRQRGYFGLIPRR